MADLSKGSTHIVRITDMNNFGVGVARVDGAVVFVRGGCDGDLAEVQIIKAASGYFVARLARLIESSPHRAESGCPVSNRCGGCVFRHITYEHELELKRGIVASAMRRAGVGAEVLPVLSTGSCARYRNKALYPIGVNRIPAPRGEAFDARMNASAGRGGAFDARMNASAGRAEAKNADIGGTRVSRGEVKNSPRSVKKGVRTSAGAPSKKDFYVLPRPVIGFFADHSHEIIPLPDGCDCLLQPEIFGKICDFTLDFLEMRRVPAYDELTGKGLIRHLYLRASEATGKVMATIVSSSDGSFADDYADELTRAFSEVSSVYLNVNPDSTNIVLGEKYRLLKGEATLSDSLCGRFFEFEPGSFWQVNRRAAEMLLETAKGLAGLKPGARVLDLFCGIGTVGIAISPKDAHLTGVEIVESAVRNAKRNAERNGFSDAEFVCCDADDPEAVAKELRRLSAKKPDAVLIDPPRGGCGSGLIDLIAELDAEKIVYISCNPNTLARDLALFGGKGYSVGSLQPVDMFPRTGHIETVCLLSKLKSNQHIEVELDMDELDLTDAEKKAR